MTVPPERIGLTLLSRSGWTFHQHHADHSASGNSPELVLVNQAAPYDHRRWDYGTTIAVNVERSELDVPMETVVRASQNLNPANPLHALVCGYLVNLADAAEESPSTLRHLAATTIQLTRTLICTAAGDGHEQEALEDSLLARIRLYIEAHLVDPGLSVASIAAAHNISVRHLYNVWWGQEVTLANWIVHQRLERARIRLTEPAAAHRTIAAIGRSSGFTDPAHFTRRFGDAYGMSPRDWRKLHRGTEP